jgi:hypothetical protein
MIPRHPEVPNLIFFVGWCVAGDMDGASPAAADIR